MIEDVTMTDYVSLPRQFGKSRMDQLDVWVMLATRNIQREADQLQARIEAWQPRPYPAPGTAAHRAILARGVPL